MRLTASNDTRSGTWNLPEIAHEVYFLPACRTQELMISVNRVLWAEVLLPGWASSASPQILLALADSLQWPAPLHCRVLNFLSDFSPLPPPHWDYQGCCCCCSDASVVSSCVRPYGLSPTGSSVHGSLQARGLQRVAVPSSRGSPWPRDQTQVSCMAGRFFTAEPPGKP